MDPFITQMATRMGFGPNDLQRAMNDPAVMQQMVSSLQSLRSSSAGPSPEVEDDNAKYTRMIDEAKRNSARERALPPGPPPPVDPKRLLQQFIVSRTQSAQNFSLRATYIGMEKHSSHTPFDKLTRISTSKMQVRRVHLGHYIICRIISPPMRLVAVQFAIEDPEGDIQTVSLYNYPGAWEASNEVLDELFPRGAILAIREPTFKMSAGGATHAHIRIDSSSDVKFVYAGDELLKGIKWRSGANVPGSKVFPSTAVGWKSTADQYFKKGWYYLASLAYSRGLHVDPTAHLLRLNRSMAYLRLEWWNVALADCDHLIREEGLPKEQRIKALFRAGQAEYGQRNWPAAKNRYESVLIEDPSQKECHEALSRTEQRILETSTGKYSWLEMFERAQKPATRIDTADYTGPIEVYKLPTRGGGRGVRAVRDIKAGELLVVCKPFACAFVEDLSPKEQILSLNFITNRADKRAQPALLHTVAERLAGDPCQAKAVYDLYPGPDLAQSPPGSLPDQNTPYVDIARIEGILTFNSFSPYTISFADQPTVEDASFQAKMDTPSALYLLPSLFNHACNSNSQWISCGDTMVIRALRDVTAGTELTVQYGGEPCSLASREKFLKSWFPICDCSLCRADRQDGAAACDKRDRIREAVKQNKEGSRQFNTSSLLSSLRDLQATYRPDRKEIRPALFGAHERLAFLFRNQGNYVEAFQHQFKAIESLGVEVIDKSISGQKGSGKSSPRSNKLSVPISTKGVPNFQYATQCAKYCLMNAALFIEAKNDEMRAERWLRAAWWIEEILTEGGPEMFKNRYKELLDTFHLMARVERVLRTPTQLQ